MAALVALPILVLFSSWAINTDEIWSHLVAFVLPEVIRNTVILVLGVSVLSGVIGVSLGWFVAMYHFPGRSFLKWGLLGSLAVPAYVLAFVYSGLFDYTGPVQGILRQWFALGDNNLIEVRSTPMVIIVLTLAFFPYVYLISYGAFSTQARSMLEASRSLGCASGSSFFRVALPMARPWIIGGLMLVAMETLADFGAVSIFVYETFTTAIYKAWFSFFSPASAAQLASLLVTFVFVLFLIELYVERSKNYAALNSAHSMLPVRLSFAKRTAIAGYAWFIWAIAFALPLMQIIYWIYQYSWTDLNSAFFHYAKNSLFIGLMVAGVVTLLGFAMCLAQRSSQTLTIRLVTRFALLGYALPGSVLAVGVFLPLVWLDQRLVDLWQAITGKDMGLILTSTLAMMVIGLTLRFLAVGFTPINNGARRISKRIDEVSLSLGVSGHAMVHRLHAPILRRSLLVGAILVFVDVIKEMPLTLMTRPFGWDTLAVRIFELTSEGEWERAALPAFFLVLTGLIPVAILARGLGSNHGR